jgi:hypothetical protein
MSTERASALEMWEAISPASATPRSEPSKLTQLAIANASTTNQPAFRNDRISDPSKLYKYCL